MARTFFNPDQLHDPIPWGYNHVVTAPGQPVFIAGQWASDGEGRVVAPHDYERQVEQAFRNLGIALGAVGASFDDVVQIGTYIVDYDPAKLAVLNRHLEQAWGERLPAHTLLGVQALGLPEVVFEIDAVAVVSDVEQLGG